MEPVGPPQKQKVVAKRPPPGHNGPQCGPCQRLAGFPLSTSLCGRFQGFSNSRWSVGQEIQRFQMVAPSRAGAEICPSENTNIASLYQRKEPGEIAARAVLNFLITRRFCPDYSLRIRVLCVADGARRLHTCEQPSAARRLASRNRRRCA